MSAQVTLHGGRFTAGGQQETAASEPTELLVARFLSSVASVEDRRILTYWAAFMVTQNLTIRTIRERMIFFRSLIRDNGSVLTVKRPALVMWMASQSWTGKTMQNYRSAMHTFFTWLQDEEFRLDNPAAKLPKVRVQHQVPNPFTPAEVQQLLDSGIYAKTRAMVALHYYLGLRVSEISRVHGRDINWTEKSLKTVGKGNKIAYMPIPANLWPLVTEMPQDSYWFPNRADNELFAAGEGHIKGSSVSNLLNDAIKRAGMNHHAHQLRAATATQMHRAGVNAFTIQHGMRHTQMDTTNRYLTVDPEDIRAGLDRIPAVVMPTQANRRKKAAQ